VLRKEGRAVAIVPFALAKKSLRIPYTTWHVAALPYLRWAMDLSLRGGGFGTRKTAIVLPEARHLPVLEIILTHLLRYERFTFGQTRRRRFVAN
jgi:hypothetical protein